jgi:hypothetical protein
MKDIRMQYTGRSALFGNLMRFCFGEIIRQLSAANELTTAIGIIFFNPSQEHSASLDGLLLKIPPLWQPVGSQTGSGSLNVFREVVDLYQGTHTAMQLP